MKKSFVLFSLLLVITCDSTNNTEGINLENRWDNHVPFEIEYNIQSLPVSKKFTPKGQPIGEAGFIDEASGLVVSRVNENAIWTHNDSNNDNLLFLLDKKNAELIARYRLDGITNIDWEDIELGPGPMDGKTYIYLGDIGDNNAVRSNIQVYRFIEPEFTGSEGSNQISTIRTDFDNIILKYPDGPRDAETLLVDPEFKDIYIITKREARVRIYVAPYPQSLDVETELILAGIFPFRRAVAGNVSIDGSEITIKTDEIILRWKKSDSGVEMRDLLATKPVRLPYNPVEPQGEAIGWDHTDGSYFTLSEFKNGIVPILYHYKKK